MEYIAAILALFIFLFTDKKKVGGIWFWKLGRLGGSFYISRANPSMNPKGSGVGNKGEILVDN